MSKINPFKSNNRDKHSNNISTNCDKEFPALSNTTTNINKSQLNNWSKIIKDTPIINNELNKNKLNNFTVENYKSYVKKEVIIDSSTEEEDSDMDTY
jgi:hypothetical protein